MTISPDEIELRATLRTHDLGDFLGLVPIKNGANNQVFKLETKQRPYLLKYYFQDSRDQRNRFLTEYTFSEFTQELKLKTVPKPIAKNEHQQFALYEWIPGKCFESPVLKTHVEQAADFFLTLNNGRNNPAAALLAPASEACFSLAEHLTCIDKRVHKLAQIEDTDETARGALEFCRNQLTPLWIKTQKELLNLAIQKDLDLAATLPATERCLSPSDFGFHNSLISSDGSLVFFDFEYAGWDDPAKMICDFFCQVQHPVPLEYMSLLFDVCESTNTSSANGVCERTRFLMPAYPFKWCCILLNEFQLVGKERRKFAGETDIALKRKQQLEKVKQFFNERIK